MTVNETPSTVDFIEPDVSDRRASNRVSFDTTLGVANFDGRKVPDPKRFADVQGSDFSHTGVSFTTTQWPTSDRVVLMFRKPAKTAYAAARIVGCRCLPRSGDESTRFEVRCEFDRWL